MTPIEIVCVCLAILCVCLSIAVTVLASVIPYLSHRLRKTEDKVDALDTVVDELCKAAGLKD